MKPMFHRISIATIAVSALLFSAVPAHAGSITMADLVGGGAITNGNLIFSDFSFSYSPSNNITLDFGACPVGVAANRISFTQDFDATYTAGVGAGAYFGVNWGYKVTTISSDYSITGINGSYSGGWAQDNSSGTGTAGGHATVVFSNAVGDVSGTGAGGAYFNNVGFAPQSEIFVNTLAEMYTSPDYDGGYSSGYAAPYQEFTVAAIPEPATALLFGLGGIGAWMLRRNKKKIEDDDDIA